MVDLKLTLRQLMRTPLFALVAVVTVGVGIGANAIVFTWIRAVLLDAIPGASQPGELMVVCPRHVSGSIDHTMSLPDIRSLDESGVFAGITSSQMSAMALGKGEAMEWVWGQYCMANFFEVLGVRPVLGRTFEAGEDRPGAGGVAVLSHRFWQRRFGGDSGVIGRVVEIARRPVTIVGVAPPGFRGTMGGLAFDLWVPFPVHMEGSELARSWEERGWRSWHTVARRLPGQSVGSTRAAVLAVAKRLGRDFPRSNGETVFAALPVWQSPWGGQGWFLPLLKALGLASGLLLLLAVANLANLLLARAQGRASEIAVRLALGAPPRRIVRLVLVESLILAGAGGGLGILLAMSGGGLLSAMMPPTYLPLSYDLSLDLRVLVVAVMLTLVTGFAFGLAPAWHALWTNLNETLKGSGRGSAGPAPRQWFRKGLVAAEVALAFAVLVGMGLCIRSFRQAQGVDLGLDPNGVVAAGFRFTPHVGTEADATRFYERLRMEAARLPGVTQVALADWLPLGFEGGSGTELRVPGYDRAPGENMDTGISVISPGYFATLRIPIVEGRDFEESDDTTSEPVVVINEYVRDRYFVGQQALGRMVRFWGRDWRVVGVAKTGKYQQLNEPAQAYLYAPMKQRPDRDLTLVVRTGGEPASFAGAIAGLARRLDPAMSPSASQVYREYVGAVYAVPRVAAILLTVVGTLALLLAMLGIYAVMAQNVGQRRRELGVRAAFGATRGALVSLVLRQGLRLSGLGLAAGVLAGVVVVRSMSAILIDVSTADLWTWGLVPPGLLLATVLACAVPAWRAARVPPIVALRDE